MYVLQFTVLFFIKIMPTVCCFGATNGHTCPCNCCVILQNHYESRTHFLNLIKQHGRKVRHFTGTKEQAIILKCNTIIESQQFFFRNSMFISYVSLEYT